MSESSKLWGNIGEMSASSPQQPAASPHTPRVSLLFIFIGTKG